MTPIHWIKDLPTGDDDETPVNGQLFDMSQPFLFMVNPDDVEDAKLVRRNSYIHRLMIEAGWTEKGGQR